ncbi:MAG: YbhB/YbcL family Raf kinase inhibitor-like protein [Candidatus Doudnabacteria bacterium]|nr:YbhB/YbcL family Raf kinase inhibitor-like protein [Candidatus Doudnabacteria bacterium]
MKIKSPAFKPDGAIPTKYACDGENINPPLEFLDVPQTAKSLVLIVDDPDAPGGTWVHWTVWNINPKLGKVEENSKGLGVEGLTSFGKSGYGGPCPPDREHRYFFKLYALDCLLELDESSDKTQLLSALQGHILEECELVGRYNRTRLN